MPAVCNRSAKVCMKKSCDEYRLIVRVCRAVTLPDTRISLLFSIHGRVTRRGPAEDVRVRAVLYIV